MTKQTAQPAIASATNVIDPIDELKENAWSFEQLTKRGQARLDALTDDSIIDCEFTDEF